MKRTPIASQKALLFGLSGAVGGILGSLIAEPFFYFDGFGSTSFWTTLMGTASRFGIVGAGIAIAILAGYFYYFKRRLQIQRAIKNVGLFGFLAGGIAGAIAQGIYSGVGPSEPLRVLCWGLAGSLLGLALSKRIPNLGLWRGLGGGAVGGILGGCLFILFTYLLSRTAGRLIGLGTIGFWIGIMLIVAETFFSNAWLMIDYDSGESRTVNMGLEPITLGSDRDLSIIYIPNVSPLALIFKLESGKILCEEVAKGTKTYLEPGEQRRVGNCTVTVGAIGETPTLSSPELTSLPTPSLPFPTTYPVSPAVTNSQFSLKLKHRIIALYPGSNLSEADIPTLVPSTVKAVVAAVTSHPKEPEKLGLKNLSEQTWWATDRQGDIKLVESGSTLTLERETQIEFGSLTGEII